IKPGDRVLLVAEADTGLAGQALAAARTRGLKVLAATSRDSAHRLAQAFKLDAVILDTELGTDDGLILLDSLKRHPTTRLVPVLEQVKKDDRFRNLPVIVYTGQELTRRDETRLKKYAQTVIIKTVGSPERLLDEATRFLHRPEAALPAEQRRMLEQLHTADAVLETKKILIV